MKPLVELFAGKKIGAPRIPWTSVRKTRYKDSKEEIIRHTLSPIERSHLGLTNGIGYIDGFGYLQPSDVGRTLVVDVSIDPNSPWRTHVVITD